MNISRGFLIIGSLYLLVGIGFGMYMGGSGDHTLAPVHAHINLLGFTLMTVFGLAYRVIPGLADGPLAQAHFWLHQAGALVLLVRSDRLRQPVLLVAPLLLTVGAAGGLARGGADGVQTRAAQAVDGGTGHVNGQTGEQTAHVGHVAVVFTGLVGAAVEHIGHGGPIDLGVAGHQGAQGHSAQVIGAHAGQRAAVTAKGRTDGVANKSL